MKVVLAFPCQKRYIDSPSMSLLPFGLLSIAAFLEDHGHEAVVIHLARFTNKDSLRLILSEEPDLIGLSVFGFQRHQCFHLAKRLKEESSTPIVLGGPQAEPLAGEIIEKLPFVDAVFVGEGEKTMLELLQCMEEGQGISDLPGLVTRSDSGALVIGGEREFERDLDAFSSVPESSFRILGVEKLYQRRHLLASRGCAGSCRFCFSPFHWKGRIRRHSPSRIAREAKYLKENYGLTHLSFRDDNFALDPKWAADLCDEVRRLSILWDCQARLEDLDEDMITKMRESGCMQVQLGFESASEKVLRKLGKGFDLDEARKVLMAFRRVALPFSLYLICGVPGESPEDIRATEAFVREMKPASLSVSRLAHYPGTAFSRKLSPDLWFSREAESFYLREDKAALKGEGRLNSLAREIASSEPYSEAELRAAIDRLSGASPGRLSLARFYTRQARLQSAIEEYEVLLADDEANPWALLEYGEALMEKGEFSLAESNLSKLVDALPHWPYALDRLAWTIRFQGREGEARELRERAMKLEPYADPPKAPVCPNTCCSYD